MFVNRTFQQWYEINQQGTKSKGGTIDFLMEHNNAITQAIHQKWDEEGNLLYGSKLKQKIKDYFTQKRRLNYEVFADWLPTDDCFVRLADTVKDKWGDAVAHIRLNSHPRDVEVGNILAEKAQILLKELDTSDITANINSQAPPNLVAGGCRFGNNKETSVLNKDCRAHEIENLFITDGSWMPTGGSITHTFTIYANSFRVADVIRKLSLLKE